MAALALALAVAAAHGRSDVATARTQVPVGLAVMLAPFALGGLADLAGGVTRAYAVEPALILLAGGLLVAALARRRPSTGPGGEAGW
jgi:hypothetical protein